MSIILECSINQSQFCLVTEAAFCGFIQEVTRESWLFLWGYNWKETLKVYGFVKKSG